MELEPVDKNNQLDLVVRLMDALAAELAQIKDSPATRSELITQIIRLGALYQSVRTGDDLWLQAR
jgi:hypothetical protein